MESLDLSVVVPLYNEEESVRLLYERISEALTHTSLRYEILFVDDGSARPHARDRGRQVAAGRTRACASSNSARTTARHRRWRPGIELAQRHRDCDNGR